MSYLVLARKWRPRTFDEVVGQATVVRTLKNAITGGRIGHAFLFSGARGVGKTTTARILAKALNCSSGEGPTAEPCGQCPSCQEIAAGTSLDVQEIDGATHNGVEQVRELRESARYNPARDRFKIWIIDEVHMLSTGAFNALLKTLEEPPPRVKFIFATTEYHKIPDTILSRCQQYDFRLIPAKELLVHLRAVAKGEAIKITEDALGRIVRAAEGSARDALSLFDQVLSFSGQEVKDEDIQALLGLIDRELLLGTSRAIAESDSLALLDLVERLSDYGADYRNFARELLLHLRELLLLKLAPADSPLLTQILPEERERLAPLAQAFSEEDLLRFVDVLVKAEAELRWAQDPRVTLEMALLKLAHLRRLMPFSELVQRVAALGGGVALPASPAVPAERRLPAPAPAGPAAAPARRAPAVAAVTPQPSEPAAEKPAAMPEGVLGRMIELAAGRPSLAQPLRTAQATLQGDTLTLALPADFLAFAEMHTEEYGALAKQATGKKLKIVLVAAEAAAAAAGPSAEEQHRQELRAVVEQEPAVQEALKLFDARIVDVSDAD
jgi:DNA polymerase III subunit gamma/tau